jgi:hypothetical protein
MRDRASGRTVVAASLANQGEAMSSISRTSTQSQPVAIERAPQYSPAMWRSAGAFALAHLLLVLGAVALEGALVMHGASPSKVLDDYTGVSTARLVNATYVEALACLLLVPAVVLLVRAFGRTTEIGRAAGTSALILCAITTAGALAIGFPPHMAASYAAHHDLDATTLATIVDLRNYGYLLQVAVLAAMSVAVGVAALAEKVMVRWVGWGGIAVGVGGLVATPFAHNVVNMAWMVWWAGLAVLCLRGAPRRG